MMMARPLARWHLLTRIGARFIFRALPELHGFVRQVRPAQSEPNCFSENICNTSLKVMEGAAGGEPLRW